MPSAFLCDLYKFTFVNYRELYTKIIQRTKKAVPDDTAFNLSELRLVIS